MKILEDLWYNKITFWQRKIPQNDEIIRLKKLISDDNEKLTRMLSPEANELLEKMMDDQGELSSLLECDTFIYGFRLGARIMLEIINETADS